MVREARQGHTYDHGGRRVMALDSGAAVRVAQIEDGWLGRAYEVRAAWLTPLPMAYFHGQVPR
ncbi:hypothetical protein NF681_11335 [Comamonadaceae bacterium OTU4NAUVB1]|nr:hypothetical protein NF681_11335 [Comamonadaceae bacterium OTU4NAUVB1]